MSAGWSSGLRLRAIGELKRNGELSRNCRCRRSRLTGNNIIEHHSQRSDPLAAERRRELGKSAFIEGIFGIAA